MGPTNPDYKFQNMGLTNPDYKLRDWQTRKFQGRFHRKKQDRCGAGTRQPIDI